MNDTDCLVGATLISVYAFSALVESSVLACSSLAAHSLAENALQAYRKISSFPQHLPNVLLVVMHL